MDLSKIAFFMAFICLIMALPALFVPHDFVKAAKKFASRVTYIRLSALFTFLFAYLVLREYCRIEKNWETVMSVLGYLLLLKGLINFWMPKTAVSIKMKMIKSENGLVAIGVLGVLIALFFGYLGYYIY